jgi:hypothetical protein
MEKPQIILHSQKSVNYTVFDVKWIPTSAKFISLGNHARGTGALDIFEITHGDISLISQVYRNSFLRLILILFFLISMKNLRRLNVEHLELHQHEKNDI